MDWNDCYERGDTPWDRGIPTPVLEEVHQRHPEIFQSQVLVPGCGSGHDARWLAEHGVAVTGLDIAPLALKQARALDPLEKVHFVEASLFDLPLELQNQFDLVWEHTCLSALEPGLRASYVAGIHAALKTGGLIAGVFFINPDLDPGETGPPYGIPSEELQDLWTQSGFRILDTWVPTTGYEGRIGRERVLVAQKGGLLDA